MEQKKIKMTILITQSQRDYLNKLLVNSGSKNMNQLLGNMITKQMITNSL